MKRQTFSLAVLAAAGLLAFSTAVRADDTNSTSTAKPEAPAAGAPQMRGPRMNVDLQVNRLTEQLSLTDDQKAKVKTALEEQNKKREEIMQATPEDRRAKMQEAREELNKKMKEILTAEQFQKFEQMGPAGRFGRRLGPNNTSNGSTNAPQQ